MTEAENTRAITLPPALQWYNEEDVESYARLCMHVCGLLDWDFAWDRSVCRLGCCKMTRRIISLSRHFVAAYLERDQDLIRRTILHELAHAMAWVHNKERNHGAAWRAWCAALGIPGERASCNCEPFEPADHRRRQVRYVLCHAETGEIYRHYQRRPQISEQKLKRCYIPGQKASTLGKLRIISLQSGQ